MHDTCTYRLDSQPEACPCNLTDLIPEVKLNISILNHTL